MVQAKNQRGSNIFPEPARPATQRRHAGLRQDLLEAAERVIESRGLPALRARELAQIVGCSVGAVYNVFADLDELILAVNAGTLAAINRRMAGIVVPDPLMRFKALADEYLNYAVANRPRWDALFVHRLPPEALAPDWFFAVQNAAFSHIEAPLGLLRPDLPPAGRASLARGIFAAVHGMVALGLEQRVEPIDLAALHTQIATLTAAIAQGLAHARPKRL